MIQFLPLLIGAGLGAMTSKKPLKGALLGAGMGALGGAGAGLLGGAGAAGGAAAPAMANGAFLGEGVASGIGAWDSAMGGGLLGGLKSAASYAQPIGAALDATKGFGAQEPVQPSPLLQRAPDGSLAALSAQLEQAAAQQGQADMARRKQRYGLLGVA